MKLFKYIVIAGLALVLFIGGCGITQHFLHKLPPVSDNCFRTHAYSFGETQEEAVKLDEVQVDSQVPEYKVVNIKITPFIDSEGSKIYICDATIDIPKSILQSQPDTKPASPNF